MKGLFLVLFLLLGTALEDATCFSRVLGDIGRRAFSLSMAQVTGGSVVALVTPMNSDYSVDFASLRSLLRWHVEKGTKGAVILGTTGEASTIDLETRTLIIKEAVSTVAGEMPIIVGTGTTDPTTALALSQNAKDCGADATLVITPYYVKPPQRALIKHFTDLANSVDIPMILYNCPGRTGVDMLPETVAQIAAHPRVIGIKDATGDLSRVAKFRELLGKNFLLYSGEDDQGCEHVCLGGDGVISVTANAAPALEQAMLAYAQIGDRSKAEAINQKLLPLHKAMFLESNPIPAKRAMNILGKMGPAVRPPLCELDEVHEPTLKEALIIAEAI